MYVEQQISILEWFLKDHVTLSNDAENSAFSITGMSYIWPYIQIETSYFKLK